MMKKLKDVVFILIIIVLLFFAYKSIFLKSNSSSLIENQKLLDTIQTTNIYSYDCGKEPSVYFYNNPSVIYYVKSVEGNNQTGITTFELKDSRQCYTGQGIIVVRQKTNDTTKVRYHSLDK
ncbi:hypothetical protein Q1W71_16995 [Flavobacterium pectinovorum]|uniref:hypothetical protein n=1 Tax=Flavobacterium pectinovorum TaxID=29533 RepID=UPI00265F0A66|nr:hypothetical protein [Flavobacterium pectinovorum]WKL46652.1 hypothetical protein Q1W71_16995 [Flavobacterium pectinovorum]